MLGAEALFTPLDTQAFRVLSTIPQRQSVAGDFSVSLFYIGELRTNQCFMMLGALRTNRAGSGKLRTIRGRPARMTAGSGDVGLFLASSTLWEPRVFFALLQLTRSDFLRIPLHLVVFQE